MTQPAGATGSLTPAPGSGTTLEPAPRVLCRSADSGRLRAKLQGAIDAEIAWSSATEPQCLGGPRPTGDGIRLLYKGAVAGEPLLVVIGVGTLARGASGRHLPANLTLIREGTGVFYATQGDDKCSLDSVQQAALTGQPDRFKLTGRGFCTQPARALGVEGAVLVSRFDVEAIIEYPRQPIE